MLRCAASFVIATYVQVLLIPQDSHALPEPAPAKAGGAFYAAVVFNFLQVLQGEARRKRRLDNENIKIYCHAS
jgi:hypothetical protein